MILFVGDKPSPRMKPGARPFEGAACENRLMEWIEFLIPFDDLDIRGVTKFRIVNSDNDDNLKLALIYTAMHQGKVVALGNKAAKRLSKLLYWEDYFKLPHPSGKNRQLNNKEFIIKKLKECKLWLTK